MLISTEIKLDDIYENNIRLHYEDNEISIAAMAHNRADMVCIDLDTASTLRLIEWATFIKKTLEIEANE